MLTYTGIHVTREFGAPSIRDIAVQSMRLNRFGGAGEQFWPVGMHSLLVADLCPPELEVHALLHDADETVLSDALQPFKTDAHRELEKLISGRIYAGLGLTLPTAKEKARIKIADIQAVNAEGASRCGPRGFTETQHNCDVHPLAAERLAHYLGGLLYEDMLDADGMWPEAYEKRLRCALRAQRWAVKCA